MATEQDRPPDDHDSAAPARRGVVGSVIGRVVPAVMNRVDTNELIEHLDVNAIAARLDVDALVDRLDVNAVADRLDLDALVDRLDVNAVADRIDLDAVVDRIDMAQIAAGATQDVTTSGLDLVRRQFIRADVTVERVVDRTLHRSQPRPAAPPLLRRESEAAGDGGRDTGPHRSQIGGHYTGPVTRLLSLAGDVFGSLTLFGGFATVILYLLGTFAGVDVTITSGSWIALLGATAWYLAWFWGPVALFGRTPVMAIAGIAVVDREGRPVGSGRAFVRALVLPLSVAMLGLGLIGTIVGRERRSLHDVVAGTVVVYDWGPRAAEQPVTIRDLLSARVRRRTADPQVVPGSATASGA